MAVDDVGERLQRARVVVGLSRGQVARALDISRLDVARIEGGRRRVSATELSRMARLYRKPSPRCLLEPAGAPAIRHFRSDYRVDERDLMVIEEVGDWFDYYAWLEQAALGAQRYGFPTYPVPTGEPAEQGEHLALEERRRLGLGDDGCIPSMVELLEQEGVKVAVEAFHPRSPISGCYQFSEALGPCVILNRRRHPALRRFAAAHEYAHLLTEREDLHGEVCLPSRREDPDEQRADAFASAFLLPAAGIAAILGDLEGDDADGEEAAGGEVTPGRVRFLSDEFGVSYHAVVTRLADLGWIGPDRHRYLERKARLPRHRLWTGESGVPGGAETEPVRFRAVAVEAWHARRISTGRLADLLEMPSADVRLLLHRQALDPERSYRVPSAEPDRL